MEKIIKDIIKVVVAVIVSAGILLFFIDDIVKLIVDLDLAEVNLLFIILAGLSYISVFYLRAIRFSLFFKKSKKIYVMNLFNVSQFLSTILPLRLGDLLLLRLKDKNTSFVRIVGIYIFVKLLDLAAVILLFLIFTALILDIIGIYIALIIYIVAFFVTIETIIFSSQFLKIRKIKRILEKSEKIKQCVEVITHSSRKKWYKLWILTNSNWVLANLYAVLFISAISDQFQIARILFANTGMIFGGMIPLPNIGGYGILESIWAFLSSIGESSVDFSSSFSYGFLLHTYALLLGLVVAIVSFFLLKKRREE